MKYWYWVLGVVVVGGIGVAGYYYGPGLLEALNQNTHKNSETDISSSHSDADSSSSNDWDLLIQAADAGRNAELVASVLMGKHLLFQFEIFGTNRYKISNIASNGDVTFEYEVLSVDVQIPDKVKQEMLDQGGYATEPPEGASIVDLGWDSMVGYAQKSIFTKAAFISMLEDWKVGSFAVGNWHVYDCTHSSSINNRGSYDDLRCTHNPNYVTSITIQCAKNDWDCLIEAADAGNSARMVASSQFEKQGERTLYPTNECKVGHVASNGDVDFGYMMTAVRVKFDRDFKNRMVAEGKTGVEIEQYKGKLEAEWEGFLDGATLTKTSFRALISHWKDGEFDILDLEHYRQLGMEGAQSPSLDDADTNTNMRTGQEQTTDLSSYVHYGKSMEPTLSDGATLSVDDSQAAMGNLKRGDIVLFRWPKNVAYKFVDRIVGLPGETVKISGGKVYINGVVIDEPYLKAGETTVGDVTRKLGSNEYFVMGDNRHNSSDSRLWGPVDTSYIQGKVVSWGSSSPDNASTGHFIDGSMIGL